MRRRPLIAGLAALPLLPRAAVAWDAPEAWATWRARFLAPDGRVVDDGQGGISHSEGQGYALLLAQAFDDRDSFDLIEDWTRRSLANRQDALMSWAWDPARAEHVIDWHNATDGDLFRAWALLRAARVSGWPVDLSVVEAICRYIVALCLAPDPGVPGALLLRPGAEARRDDAGVLVNPSYYHLRALRDLGAAFGLPALTATADHGDNLLRALAAAGPVPDWIEVTGDGVAPPRDHAMRSSYDALRVPLYLAWSGMADHPAAVVMRDAMRRATHPGHVAVSFAPDGSILAESDQPGYRAIETLASGKNPRIDARDPAVQPYYPATLQLLCHVAARERHN
ncbi:glycosyl hydrolase family 8 [Pseudooceanicola sp. LIPI14-2-Ac024]|uniref:glycosyl hydrolase family 8 n=1 Tax=Pseudooceanicola sp. LIPI14-2-Ac024 TaxID=3344875 RepID=UPI0035D0B898